MGGCSDNKINSLIADSAAVMTASRQRRTRRVEVARRFPARRQSTAVALTRRVSPRAPISRTARRWTLRTAPQTSSGAAWTGRLLVRAFTLSLIVFSLITIELLQRLGRTTRGARRCRPALPRSLVAVTTRSRPPTGPTRKAAVYRQSSAAALTTSRQLREST
jgi:hypothetical protein